MKSGVYIITNTINNKHYIGESVNWKHRLGQHKSTLISGKHDNEYLQKSYDKYGMNIFTFELLEECEEFLLPSIEHYWVNTLRTNERDYGYNIKSTHPERKGKMSQEHKRKIQELLANKSKEHIAKIQKAKYASGYIQKISHRVVQLLNGEIIREYDSLREAMRITGVDKSQIVRVCKGKEFQAKGFQWKYI